MSCVARELVPNSQRRNEFLIINDRGLTSHHVAKLAACNFGASSDLAMRASIMVRRWDKLLVCLSFLNYYLFELGVLVLN